jgi:hypothetical protein
MEIFNSSFDVAFDIILLNDILIKSSHVLLLFLYNEKYLEHYTDNSIYGTLKKSIFNIPIGTPIKIVIVNENIVNIYFVLNYRFYSIPIELIQENLE